MDRRRFLSSLGGLAFGGMTARGFQSIAAIPLPFSVEESSPQASKAYDRGTLANGSKIILGYLPTTTPVTRRQILKP